jgi:CelD/BcsL family acetyltransferase involved in cellulose biosynthesis
MSSLTRVRLKLPGETPTGLRVQTISSFDDPLVAPRRWNELLAQNQHDFVNLTWEWQRNWWNSFGRGQLMLLLIEQDGQPVCIAPLFAQDGMVFNLCPEDQLDFVGSASTDVMRMVMQAVLDRVPNFLGLKLYFIPDTSITGAALERAAEQLGLTCVQEETLAAPRLDMAAHPDLASRHARKKSLLRHENGLRRRGQLTVTHTREAADIMPQLDEFFRQHIARRNATPHPSRFVDAKQREYYRSIVRNIGPHGWLRFTRLELNEEPIAFHLGLSYQGRFLYGVPSFNIAFERNSPGEVLLRQLLLAAVDEGASLFDFGPGEEAYKDRFATSAVRLVTWGVYPRQSFHQRTAR